MVLLSLHQKSKDFNAVIARFVELVLLRKTQIIC